MPEPNCYNSINSISNIIKQLLQLIINQFNQKPPHFIEEDFYDRYWYLQQVSILAYEIHPLNLDLQYTDLWHFIQNLLYTLTVTNG